MRLESYCKGALANSKATPEARLILVTLAQACTAMGEVSITLAEIIHFTRLS